MTWPPGHSQPGKCDLSLSAVALLLDLRSLHIVERAYQAFLTESDAFRVHPTPAAQSPAATAADRGEWDRDVLSVAASLPNARAWST